MESKKRKVNMFKIISRVDKKVAVFTLLCLIGLWAAVPAALADGDTRYDSGLNLPFNEKAGDVNPQTGNISLSVADVELPGRGGLNFRFSRIWSLNQSNVFCMYRSPRDGSNNLNSDTMEKYNRLGVGWSCNLPYIYTDTSSGSKVVNLCFGGNVYELDTNGLGIYGAKTNPDKSNILWYDLLDLRVYRDTGLKYGDCENFTVHALAYGVADTADTVSAYVLILKDNSRYWFRADGRLMMEEDRTGLNRIWYMYDLQQRLVLAVDTVGREIRFGYDTDNNLIYIEWDAGRYVKAADGLPQWKQLVKRVSYLYESAEQFTGISGLKGIVVNYRKPFMLVGVTDPAGLKIRYTYKEGLAYFSYDSFKSRSRHVYLLLTGITNIEGNGGYCSRQMFEYEPPVQGMYSRQFYQGSFEYYKISRQYFNDRKGRIMNDTHYLYHAQGEAGNSNEYSTIITQGDLKTTYVYAVSGEKSRDNVLEKMIIETEDGFKEERDYVYNENRAKIMEEVYRGQFLFRERYEYDMKGNLKWFEDKMGLVTATEYDEKYNIPIHVTKKLEVDGVVKEYETEAIINELGQVERTLVYLEQPDGSKRGVVNARNTYDVYGNLVSVTDAEGNSVHTVYDALHHYLPVQVYQDVTIASWGGGPVTSNNWTREPDGKRKVRLRSWRVFNEDGSVWLELDNEGYALEHYYDLKGSEVMTIVPDQDDVRSFAQPLAVADGQALGNDFTDFPACPEYSSFLASRMNNPKVRREINYTTDLVKTYTDIDVKINAVKITGKQGDGLGHMEAEIEYDGAGNLFDVKEMTYDPQGRMVGLTDPDAGEDFYNYEVNGVDVKKYDKTWIVEYDDLGRTTWVIYPEIEAGRTDSKHLAYNDLENSIIATDPLGRKLYEKHDWNGNLVKSIACGDRNTKSEDIQECTFVYDKLNRRLGMIDPRGMSTTYRYDERNLLLEESYGASGSDRLEYNDLGLLVAKRDRKGQVLVMEYDEFKRNTSVIHYKNDADRKNGIAVRRVDTVYDNRGNAVRIASNNLIEYYTYDYQNRVTNIERRIKDQELRQKIAGVWGGEEAAQTFGFGYEYNDVGLVTRMRYPDGAVHQYTYDNTLGRLRNIDATLQDTVRPFVTAFDYTRSGVVTRMAYGNGTSQTWEFNNRKWISRTMITGSAGIVEDLWYRLDADGDILSINENEYTYDGFDRISSAKTLLPDKVDKKKLVTKYFGLYRGGDPSAGLSYLADADLNNDSRINGGDHILASLLSDNEIYDIENFNYDKNGNRTRLVQNGDTYTYEYGDRNILQAIRVTKKDTTENRLYLSFTYDANGNTVERILYTATGEVKTSFAYDTMNRLVKTVTEGKTTEYLYDNAGNRFIKKSPDAITLYLRYGQTAVAMDIEIPDHDPERKGTINRYVLSGDLLSGRVAKVIKNNGTAIESVSYYHLDHLNSTKCVTDEQGNVEVNYVYRAFGEQLKKLDADGKDTTDKAVYSYVGKELDDETNLYYFNARYYDATLGRFINVDPIQDGSNWYVYCSNNPMNAKDPTGLSKEKLYVTEGTIMSYDTNAYNKETNETRPENYYMTSSGAMDSNGFTKEMGEYLGMDESEFVTWSDDGKKDGGNNDKARQDAATRIANYIMEKSTKDDSISLMGHSHGGNVMILVANKLAEAGYKVNMVYTLNTPVRSDYQPTAEYKILSIYNSHDAVSTYWGAIDTNGNSPISTNGHVADLINKGLYFNLQPGININNAVDDYIKNNNNLLSQYWCGNTNWKNWNQHQISRDIDFLKGIITK